MKKNIKNIIGLFTLIVIFFFAIKNNLDVKSDILENKFQTIAKVHSVRYKLKKSWLLYEYKFENEVYYYEVINTAFGSHQFIGKYFLVDVHKKFPSQNIIYLEKEITDSLQIAKSGL